MSDINSAANPDPVHIVATVPPKETPEETKVASVPQVSPQPQLPVQSQPQPQPAYLEPVKEKEPVQSKTLTPADHHETEPRYEPKTSPAKTAAAVDAKSLSQISELLNERDRIHAQPEETVCRSN